jgi:hypothetical protein
MPKLGKTSNHILSSKEVQFLVLIRKSLLWPQPASRKFTSCSSQRMRSFNSLLNAPFSEGAHTAFGANFATL